MSLPSARAVRMAAIIVAFPFASLLVDRLLGIGPEDRNFIHDLFHVLWGAYICFAVMTFMGRVQPAKKPPSAARDS